MTPDHDIERVLERWFTEGPTQMPDRLLEDTSITSTASRSDATPDL